MTLATTALTTTALTTTALTTTNHGKRARNISRVGAQWQQRQQEHGADENHFIGGFLFFL